MQGKVEICGVNTARLKVLSQKEMDGLLRRAKEGDELKIAAFCYWVLSHIIIPSF